MDGSLNNYRLSNEFNWPTWSKLPKFLTLYNVVKYLVTIPHTNTFACVLVRVGRGIFNTSFFTKRK